MILFSSTQPGFQMKPCLWAHLLSFIPQCNSLTLIFREIDYIWSIWVPICPAVTMSHWTQLKSFSQWLLLFFGLTVHNTELPSLQTVQSAEEAGYNGCGAHPRISALINPRVMVKPESRFYSMKDSCQAWWSRGKILNMFAFRSWNETN